MTIRVRAKVKNLSLEVFHEVRFRILFEKSERLGSMTTTTRKTVQPSPRAFAAVSDEDLLVRYRDAGDVAAFEYLIHRYERPLFSYLSRYLRNVSLAEEVFQATFFRVHERCRAFTEGRRVRPWIYSIATHQAIDALRKEKRHRAVKLNDDHGPDNADAASLVELLESRLPTPPELLERREACPVGARGRR